MPEAIATEPRPWWSIPDAITVRLAHEGRAEIEVALGLRPGPLSKIITIHEIQRVTAEVFGIKVREMTSDRRSASVVYPRHVAIFLARELTSHSLPAIGRAFGNRDHTTVIHSLKRVPELCRLIAGFADKVAEAKARLEQTAEEL